MSRVLAWLALATVLALLGVGFLRALPAAVERARAGATAAERAACASLQPEMQNPALGAIDGTREAPDFKLKDWAGREVQLSSLRGRVVLVNFWATWCQTCVVEMPSLGQLAEAERGKPFTLLAVSVDDDWNAVREFFREGTPLTVLLDQGKTVPPRYGTEKFPETFVVDRDGKVRYYVVSDRNWMAPDVKSCIDALIAG
jgi:thiol-disulfide isomerase/thioredoxin